MPASPLVVPLTFNPPAHPEDSFSEALFGTNTPWAAAGTPLPGWCIRLDVLINPGMPYAGYVYSSYETLSLGANLPATYLPNLDNVNWLLNYYRSGSTGYNATDVQTAIWQLMHQMDNVPNTALTNLALANDGYVPDAGETLALIIDPVRADGTHDQTSIVETKAAKLGDRVWEDRDADGLQDAGEAGIAGATVQLVRDMNGDGQFTAPGEVLASTTTDANGNYSFKGLTPGLSYQVQFIAPAGYDAASARQVDGSSASGANSDGKLSDVIVLNPGEYNPTIDSGYYKYAAIGDRVWFDTNANGVQDSGEAGAANITVKLLNAAGQVLATQTTDANGNYLFSQLTPGQYAVEFDKPANYIRTKQDAGADGSDSDANVSTGRTGLYTLASGERNLTVDSGLVKAAAPTADSVKVCEDRSVSFNVLANDGGAGLKLVGVAHENASLDSTFKARAGALSFTADGVVTYKTMTNYYGNDKLVYTLEDVAGNRFTQTVDVKITAVSDAPIAQDIAFHPDGKWDKNYTDARGVQHLVHKFDLADFGKFSDANDQLQQFGTYNQGVANDVDSLSAIVIYGLTGPNARYAEILLNGKVLDLDGDGQRVVQLDDIRSGKLEIDFTKKFVPYDIEFAMRDTGVVDNAACYNGTIWSASNTVSMSTPIALDLNGDHMIGVTGATASSQKDANAALGRTVQFDIDGNGTQDTIEWFNGSGDGILIDNRDGGAAAHMDGSRLFGDQGGQHDDGYAKLRLLDANGDGKLSGSELAGIQLWVDNGDAVVQAGELQTLAQHGITAISTDVSLTVDAESRVHLQSSATRDDGSTLMSEDVFFAQALPAASELLATDASLDALLGASALADAAPADVSDVSQAAELLRKLYAQMEAHAATA